MSRVDWVQSCIIFALAVYLLNSFFISLTIFEAIVLTFFTAICIIHTMDVRDDLKLRAAERRARKRQDDVDGG